MRNNSHLLCQQKLTQIPRQDSQERVLNIICIRLRIYAILRKKNSLAGNISLPEMRLHMSELFEKLVPHIDRMQAYNGAMALFDWDNETLAPSKAIEHTSKMVGVLSSEAYKATVNEEIKELLEKLSALEEQSQLSSNEKAIVKKLKKDYDYMEKIPPKEYQAYNELTARSSSIWAAAREKNDFNSFAPVLEEIVGYQKKFANYIQKPGMGLYDALLNEYEEGLLTADLDVFFDKIRTAVVPLLKKVTAQNDRIDKAYNSQNYPIDKQKEFCRFLAEYIGFDFSRGVMAESAHPFTTELHNKDVRITNHFYKNNLESAIFSVIHEGGHALYEMGVADELTMTPAGGGTSMGVHESQSRFYENVLGRSEAFWKPLFPRLKETYPEQLKDLELDTFIHGINKAVPGPIRTEADELTYPLHIMVRYEIEKLLIAGEISVKDLPELWNKKYKEYLGITPANDKEGVLQDVHWAGGMFGYFPSYAIGNAVAAQIYAFMHKEIKVKECLETSNLKPIQEYLRQHIHQYGATKNMEELLMEMTGKSLDVDYYIDYLTEKYTSLYLL